MAARARSGCCPATTSTWSSRLPHSLKALVRGEPPRALRAPVARRRCGRDSVVADAHEAGHRDHKLKRARELLGQPPSPEASIEFTPHAGATDALAASLTQDSSAAVCPGCGGGACMWSRFSHRAVPCHCMLPTTRHDLHTGLPPPNTTPLHGCSPTVMPRCVHSARRHLRPRISRAGGSPRYACLHARAMHWDTQSRLRGITVPLLKNRLAR